MTPTVQRVHSMHHGEQLRALLSGVVTIFGCDQAYPLESSIRTIVGAHVQLIVVVTPASVAPVVCGLLLSLS